MSTEVAPLGDLVAIPGERQPPAQRGHLVLADKVVEKIASQAATEVGATHGRAGGRLRLGPRAGGSARPDVDVELSSDSADLSLTVGIAYPGSIRRATHEIRTHVVQRVQELTGVTVQRVDLDVAFLDVLGPVTDRHRKGLR